MTLPQATPDDLAAVKAWFRELAEHVQAVDFAAARYLFAEDFLAFGTFTDFMIGRELAEKNQWRNVWPTIDGFVWRLDDAKALVSPDRLFAVGLAVWDSTGYLPDGKPFDRKGRATVSFTRTKIGDPFVATHTHMSLADERSIHWRQRKPSRTIHPYNYGPQGPLRPSIFRRACPDRASKK
jgi:ketosteroid isomerase-like protein